MFSAPERRGKKKMKTLRTNERVQQFEAETRSMEVPGARPSETVWGRVPG